MKKIRFLLAILPFAATLSSQVITLSPALPTDLDSVTIVFDASQGNQGLINYTGDVYAHTGVITNLSSSNSDWKHVKTNWGVNDPSCKLSRLGANLYALSLKPSIRAYYGVPPGETIRKIALVFRSALPVYKEGKEAGNADIFGEVFEAKLNVSFSLPSTRFTLDTTGAAFNVEVNSLYSDSIALFLNNTHLKSSYTSQLLDTIPIQDHRLNRLVARAYKGAEVKNDTAWFLSKGTPQSLPLPEGVRDGINYINDSTACLSLHAPYKEYIYLFGDFNDWIPDSIYLLNRDEDRFWITLTHLKPGKEYAFQYLVDGVLKIADPYSEKILDPWNDKYIPTRIYPSLLPYPVGKTTDIAGVLQTNRTPFNWDSPHYLPPQKEKLIIYELLIRDFTSNSDIKTVTDTLAYLKKLGINAIELMPISEFEGNDSWGYNPSFYFAPDKAYGTIDDYKRFIDACHKLGIAVIQDMVLNHSFSQSPLVRLYFDGTRTTAQNPWYNINSPNTSYSWGHDFNHESPATQAFVDRVTSWWLSEYKVDGFRFDFTKGFTNTPGDGWAYDASRISILKRMADQIWAVNPNAYVILEHFADNQEEKALADYGMLVWGNMNGTYNEASMGYNESGKSNISGISYISRGWSKPGLVGYMESHDEERLMVKNTLYGNNAGIYDIQDPLVGLKRMELVNAFFLLVPGPKMIWQFGELGYDVSIDFNGRLGQKPPHWDYLDVPSNKMLYRICSKMIRLKDQEAVFSTSDFSVSFDGPFKKMTLRTPEDTVLLLGNFDVFDNSYTVSFPQTGTWYEYFHADSLQVITGSESLHLDAGEYRLYSKRKLEGYGSLRVGLPQTSESAQLRLYPNPASSTVRIDGTKTGSTVYLYDLFGRLLLRKILTSEDESIELGQVPAGTCLLRLISPDGASQCGRIIIMH